MVLAEQGRPCLLVATIRAGQFFFLPMPYSPQSTKSILTLPVISCAVTSRVWLGHWRWWCTARGHPGPSTSVPLSWGLAWPPFLPVLCSGPKSTSLLQAGEKMWLKYQNLNCITILGVFQKKMGPKRIKFHFDCLFFISFRIGSFLCIAASMGADVFPIVLGQVSSQSRHKNPKPKGKKLLGVRLWCRFV